MAVRLSRKIIPSERYKDVNITRAIASNNKNLLKDNFIESARMGANMRIRGMKHKYENGFWRIEF